MNYLQQLLVSGMPLWITNDGFRKAMLGVFPTNGEKVVLPNPQSEFLTDSQIAFLKTHNWYQLKTRIMLESLRSILVKNESTHDTITITDEFDDEDLPDNSIAYHRIWGVITADSRWWFSSKQLDADIKTAESNPHISCHVLHINSPGGEAWYLDRLSETLRNCKKPILTIFEQYCCSAGYYIGCHGNKIYALTANDYVGCIGTMCSFYDFEGYFANLGIKLIEAKATNSDLKGKTFDDLRHGKSEKYINDFLNPLNEQFLSVVRSQRSKLTGLPDDAPVLRGETFLSASAIEIGLTDGIRTLSQAIAEALIMGREYTEEQQLKSTIYNFV